MLRDITIGQYIPTGSIIHKMDSRMKILLITLYIVNIFFINNIKFMLVPFIYVILGYTLSKIPFRFIFKSLKPMIPIIVITAIVNLFFISGEVIYKFYFLEVTKEGIIFSSLMLFRILLLVLSTSLLTYTTSPIELTNAIEYILKPLKVIKFPVHEVSMMMSISLRFIPTLLDELEKIIDAQKSRGSDIDTGGFIEKIKAMVPVLVPLFISSFKRADELALAMECRCYSETGIRTRLKKLKCSFFDFFILLLSVLMYLFIFYFRK